MAATGCVVKHGALFAIPLRQGIGDPADIIKVAIEKERAFRPEDILDHHRLLATRDRRGNEGREENCKSFRIHVVTFAVNFVNWLQANKVDSGSASFHSVDHLRSVQAHPSRLPDAKHLYMPEKETIERAREDAREGKSPSTQAGEFVREEMEHIREGKHGARSTKQAIAIGLSKARRAGVKLAPPKRGSTSRRTRKQAKRDLKKGESPGSRKTSQTRSRAVKKALKREPRSAA